jgi:hypothetical protein
MVMHQPNDPRPQHVTGLTDILTGNTGQKQQKRRKENLKAYHKMLREERERRRKGQPPQYQLPYRAFLWKDGKKTAVSLDEYNAAQSDPNDRIDTRLYYRPPEYYNPKTGTYVESDDVRHDWETWYRIHRPTKEQRAEDRKQRGGKDKSQWNAGDWAKAISVGMFRGVVDPLGSVEDIGQGDFLQQNQAYGGEEFAIDVGLTVAMLGAGHVVGKTMKAEMQELRTEMGVTFDSHLRYRNLQRLETAMKRFGNDMQSVRAQNALLHADALENADERYIRQRATLEADMKAAKKSLANRVQNSRMSPEMVRRQTDMLADLYKTRFTHIRRSYQRNIINTRAEVRLNELGNDFRADKLTAEDLWVLTRRVERERSREIGKLTANYAEGLPSGDASMPDMPNNRSLDDDILHNYEALYNRTRKSISNFVEARKKARLDAMEPAERNAHYKYDSRLLEDPNDREAFDFAYDVYHHPDVDGVQRAKTLHGYTYDEANSTKNFGVWYNPETNRLHISHRGSVETLADWLGSDVQILTGTEGALKSDRFNTALQRLRRVHAEYEALHHGVVVDQSGHSLGAGVGQYIMGKDGTLEWMGHAYGFNGGASPAPTPRLFLSKSPEERAILEQKMTNIRQTLDAVSGSRAPFGKMKTYHSTSNPALAHSMDSFALEGTRVEGSVEALKAAAKNPQTRLFATLTGSQLRQIARSKGKHNLTVDDLINLKQADVDRLKEWTPEERRHMDTLVYNKEFAEHTNQPEEVTDVPVIDIGSGGFVHRADYYGGTSTGAEDVWQGGADAEKSTPDHALPVAYPVKDTLPTAAAVPIYHATPVYDKDGKVVFDAHSYTHNPDQSEKDVYNAGNYVGTYTGGYTMADDMAEEDALQFPMDGGGGGGRPAPQILGYIAFPASQADSYYDSQIVFD